METKDSLLKDEKFHFLPEDEIKIESLYGSICKQVTSFKQKDKSNSFFYYFNQFRSRTT